MAQATVSIPYEPDTASQTDEKQKAAQVKDKPCLAMDLETVVNFGWLAADLEPA